MFITIALMFGSVALGLFVAALIHSAFETYQQCAEE